MARYWPSAYYNKYGKLEIPYKGESQRARLYEYTRFPYTYSHDVPGVKPYHYDLPGVKPFSYDMTGVKPFSYDMTGIKPYGLSGITPFQRSLYGRATQSDYGYRAPYTYRSELFTHRHPGYYHMDDLEQDYYKEYFNHPRYSRYHNYWY